MRYINVTIIIIIKTFRGPGFAGFPKSLVFEKLILMKENKRLLIIEVKNILTNV